MAELTERWRSCNLRMDDVGVYNWHWEEQEQILGSWPNRGANGNPLQPALVGARATAQELTITWEELQASGGVTGFGRATWEPTVLGMGVTWDVHILSAKAWD